jgi:hypothetical protein
MGCTPFSWTWFGAGFLVSLAASAQGAPPPGATFPPLPAGSAAIPPAAPPGSTPTAAPTPVAPTPTAPPAPVAPAPVAPTPAPAGYPPAVYPPPAAVPPPASAPFVASNHYAFAPTPRQVWPEDAAVQSSPFMDATISLISLEDRFLDPLVFGIGFGAYLGRLVRVVARLEMPSTSDGDERYDDSGYTSGYSPESAGSVTLLYGGSVGIVAAHSVAFVFSPGVTFLRTDVAEYGNMLGVAIPFEWTTSKGLRFGLEVGVGRAFGGSQKYECTFGPNCVVGETKEVDRDDARALTLRFELGFGFNHPPPEKSRPVRLPEPSPEPWRNQHPGVALPPPAYQPPAPAPAPSVTPGF